MNRTPLRRKTRMAKKRSKPRRKSTPAKRNYENGVKVFPDGREICMATREGITEYKRRREEMADRQGWRCGLEQYGMCLHPGVLMREAPGMWESATFEHLNGRGAGKQDDRIWVVDPETGERKPMNCAAHFVCNSEKRSRRVA